MDNDPIPIQKKENLDDDEGEDHTKGRIGFSSIHILQSIWIQRTICRYNALHKLLLDYILYFLRTIRKSFSLLSVS